MICRKKYTLLFYFLLNAIALLAQPAAKDSLQITQSINQAFDLYLSHPDSALQLAKKGLQVAETVKDTQGLVNLWRIKGLVHYAQHNMELALLNFENSFAFANQINYRKSRLLINLGNTYYQQQSYETAAEKYEQAIEFNTKGDTLLSIDALNNLGSVCISTGKFEKAIDYYQKSLTLQKAIDKLQLPTFINMAQTYSRMNQLNKSIKTYETAKDLAAARTDTTLLVIIYRRMGNVYKKQGAYFQSIQIFQEALALQKLTHNQRGVANTLHGMGIVFYEQKNHETSLAYLKQALEIGKAEKDYRRQGGVLDFIGRNYQEQLKYEQALTAFQSAKQIYKEHGFEKNLMYPFFSIGDTYERLNQLDSAVFYLNQADELAQNYNQNNLKAAIQTSLGKVAQKKGDISVALQYFKQAINAAKLEGLLKEEADAAMLLADLLKKQNKQKEALFYLERYLTLKDTLFNEESTQKLAQLEAKNQFEQEKQDLIYQNEVEKQKLDNEIQRQRIWQLVLGAALILSLLLWLFYSRYQRLNAQINAQRLLNEQKERERLVEMDTFKNRFFTNIAHELRTPLTLILGPVQRLLKKSATIGEKQPMLELIQDNAQNLLVRVNEILDLSKIETKEIQLKETPTLLYDFSKKLLTNFDEFATQKAQILTFDYQLATKLTLLLDQGKFTHVFNNYLSNALKFTPEGGQVKVVFRQDNRPEEKITNNPFFIFEVKDTGPGIPKKDIPHIFERFYQVEDEDDGYIGTGIGLALTKEMTKLMQGKVGVKSERGQGSTFYCTLPLKVVNPIEQIEVKDKNKTNPIVSEPPLRTPERANKILVVEDNPQLNDYLSLILSECFEVITAKNGQMALEQLAISSCDLILSDIMMPIMNGFELLARLKSSDQFCHIPIIMLTAKGEAQDKLTALRIGVDDYLTKPFIEEELILRIQNLLTNQRNRQLGTIIEEAPNTLSESITNSDLKWLKQVEIILKQEMSNGQFTFDHLANQLFISRSQLQRRIKKITGLTPNKYFREIRLQTARVLLESGNVRTISEVAHAVGFDTPKYFVKIFQERYGKHPKNSL